LGLVIGNEVSEHDMQIALSVYLYYNNKANNEAYVEVQEYRSGKPVSSVSLVMTSKANSETIKQYILSYS